MTSTDSDVTPIRRGPRRVQAVDHAIDVLEAIAQAAGAQTGVSDIARRTGLSKATVHHLLGTLETRRMVIKDPQTSTYRLGWSLYELGSVVVRGTDVSRVARPILDRLAVETSESVLLGILDGDSVLYLDRGDAPHGFQMVATAGRRSPLHATASGKLLLAFADEATVGAYLERPLQRFTDDTITDPDVLRRQLDVIRRDGYATCWQERELGLCSVAVRLRNHLGETVASLTLVGPAGRLTPENVDAHVAPLREAEREIEQQLGFDEGAGAAGAA
ncbi:IclR family transcriptional regulator [Conexibacter stalactiti]|uniref:IclR family transcriptional regulator n=1 Tax=Conexibacter stalactiti TaxID=1940611 RepID=A0ABU4HW18_9ACTN|nr:IclR family transcriptional regulator [Conexibacter stalactiti]MDW5597420.1 IclR family transcriptional regulator [Conexibacter stalactiti]MEC5038062.1 IclR family transcriptional regulator [Conexibacter stalactiti]